MGVLRIPTSPVSAIALAGLVAAAYFVATVAFAPFSYGPVQLRIAGLLAPVVLLDRRLALGIGVGVFLANLTSPFGVWDWGMMPPISFGAALLAYHLRRVPWLAVTVQAAIIAAAVTIFPLGMGGGLPFWPVVLWVFVSNAAIFLAGWYVIWRNVNFWEGRLSDE